MGLRQMFGKRQTTADPKQNTESIDSVKDPVEDVVDDALVKSTLQSDLMQDVTETPEDDDEKAIAEALSQVDKKLTSKWFGKDRRKVDVPGAIELLLDLSDQVMKAVLAGIHQRGRLDDVLGQVPAVLAKARPGDMLRLYSNAPVSVLIERCKDLLSLGVFDWAVQQHEVDAVLDILAALPADQRQAFLEADNGRYYDVLMQVQASTDAKNAKEKEEKEAKAKPNKESTVTSVDEGEQKPGLFKRIGAGAGVIGDLFSSKVNLNKVQTAMGGSVAGVKFDEAASNTMSWEDSDWKRGLFHAELPQLGIKTMSVADIKTGAVSAEGVVAEAKWRTEADKDTWTHLGLKSLKLGDVQMAFGGSEYKLSSLELKGVKVDGKDSPITQARPMKKGEALGLIANQIGSMVGLNLPAIKGALGGDYSQPETLGSRMSDQFGADQNLEMSVDQVGIVKVEKDGVQMVADMTLDGLKASVNDTLRSELLQEELTALEAKTEPTEQQVARIKALKSEIEGLKAQEGRLKELEGKWASSSLTRKEQDELIALRNRLTIGTASLSVNEIHGNGVEMADGTGVQKLDAKGFSMRATGGAIEEARRHETRGQQLDGLISKRQPAATVQKTDAVPEMKITGGFDQVDAKGVSYSYKDRKDTRLDLSASKVGFGMEGDNLDLSAGSYDVNNFAFDPYQTTLNKGSGKNLSLSANTKTYAFGMNTTDVALDQLDVGAYKTKVEKGSAGSFQFGMGANGDMSFGGTDIGANGVTYDEGGGTHTTVGSASVKTMKGSMTGTGEESATSISGTGLNLGGVAYKPMDVNVGSASAESFKFDMYDEDPCDGVENTHMRIGADGVGANGVTYGKEGTSGFLGVDKATSSHLGFDMFASGDMALKSPDLSLSGVQQGNTKGGKGTKVKQADLSGISSNIGADGSTNSTVAGFTASGIDSRDAGLGIKTASGKGLDVRTNDDGVSLGLNELSAGGIDERNSGATVKSANAKGIKVGMPTEGDLTASVKSGGLNGIKHSEGSASSLGFTDLSLRKGEDLLDVGVGTVSGKDVRHKSGAKIDGFTGGGLSFKQEGDDLHGGIASLDANGVSGYGASAKTLSVRDLSGGKDKTGIYGDLGSLDVTDASYTSEDANVALKTGSVKGVKARGLDFSGAVPKGDLDVNQISGTGITGDFGEHHVTAKEAHLNGLYGSSDGTGSVIGGVDDAGVSGVTYNGDGVSGSLQSLGMQDARVGLSGVGTDKMGVDGVSVGTTTAKGLDLDARLGKKLQELFPKPVMEQLGLPDLNTTMPADNTRVVSPVLPMLEKSPAPQYELVPGSKLDAGALAGASGRVELEVPIRIDLSDYYLGTISADAKLSVQAHDGVIELKDIDLDLDWIATAAKVAGGLANAALASKTGLSIGDYGLNIRPGGELAIWFDIEALVFSKRVEIGVFEGGKYGMSDGKGSKGDHISLQKLAEGLGSSPPSVRQVESTKKSGDVLGETAAMVDDVSDYIDVKNIKLKLQALKMSDGHLGNESFGLDFVDSDQKGVNQLDASITTGGSSYVEAKDLRAKDLSVGGDKGAKVKGANVKGARVDVSDPLGSLKGDGTAHATMESATLTGTSYGSDLSKDPRFARRKK